MDRVAWIWHDTWDLGYQPNPLYLQWLMTLPRITCAANGLVEGSDAKGAGCSYDTVHMWVWCESSSYHLCGYHWAQFLLFLEKLWFCSMLLISRMRAALPLFFNPVSRPYCLPPRLICGSGCRWCRRLLNVSFGPSAWFLLPLFLFIYFVYQFVTQMNNGWGRLLPRRQAKLIIVMCLLAKTRSPALPPPPTDDSTSRWQIWYIGTYLFDRDWVLAVVLKLIKIKRDCHERGTCRKPQTHKQRSSQGSKKYIFAPF